jgi:hypothetical protein
MIGGTDPNDGSTVTASVAAVNAALATLRRVGKNDDAQGLVDAAAADTAAAYDNITNDPARSDSWKIQQSAIKYLSTMSSLATRLTAAANIASTQDADDQARVFGIKGLDGDPASLQIAHRDAIGRVNDMDAVNPYDTASRRALLANATRFGDTTLAHVLVESAVRNGDADTVNDFQAAYPQLAAATERLWDTARRGITTVGLTVAMQTYALKPAILGSLQDFEIDAAAAGRTDIGRWNVGSEAAAAPRGPRNGR